MGLIFYDGTRAPDGSLMPKVSAEGCRLLEKIGLSFLTTAMATAESGQPPLAAVCVIEPRSAVSLAVAGTVSGQAPRSGLAVPNPMTAWRQRPGAFIGGQKHDSMRQIVDERDARVIFYREIHGESYSQIGRRVGLTRQRVGAILKAKRPDLTGKRA